MSNVFHFHSLSEKYEMKPSSSLLEKYEMKRDHEIK